MAAEYYKRTVCYKLNDEDVMRLKIEQGGCGKVYAPNQFGQAILIDRECETCDYRIKDKEEE